VGRLNSFYDKGKIYEGERVLMYDTKWATPLSKAEVTMDAGAYIEVTDPSVYVKFRLTPESIGESTKVLNVPVYFMAWTTTPWTLPANTGVAVNPDIEYVEIKLGDEVFIVAEDLADNVFTDEKHQVLEYEVLHKFKGSKLVGKTYEPLFEDRGSKRPQSLGSRLRHD